ncbi:Aste57867_20791 [Aphanomyces stellatus]|uniref:Aste57867_20791 protein n=1 Tax=Aphanomyces stellatus TaxID=120398 RepID=A0A485LFY7_9STRA|nr:hypothetical protein As57867_020723 [Aphanomyces stellatus]VFT97470.1 Aste57867_20791 [Aphanomyces stellatus]
MGLGGLAILALIHVCVAQVHVLTSQNFKQQVLQSGDYWLVEFYAPWCGHCKQLEPEWKSAAKQLKSKAKLGAVDCTVHTDLAQQFGIKGYPTIKEFGKNKKKPKDYQGGRQARDIVQYVQNSPQSGLVETVATLTYADMSAFLDSKQPCVIIMGRNKKKKGQPRWVEDIAQEKYPSKVKFGFVSGHDDKIATHFAFHEDDRPLVLFAQHSKYTWTKLTRADRIKDDVAAFLQKSFKSLDNAQPLPSFPPPEDNAPKKKPPVSVQRIDAKSFESACLNGVAKMCVVYIPATADDGLDLKATAKQFRRDPFSFFWVDPQDVAFIARAYQWLGIDKETKRGHCLVFKKGKQIRVADMDNLGDTNTLDTFLTHVLEGLEPFRAISALYEYDHTEL